MNFGGEQMTALFSLLGLITTTIGGCVLAYMAYKQRKIEADLELARLEAVKAAKNSRRTNRNVKSLSAKTDAQTEILTGTQQDVVKLKEQTNGMQERLLKEAASRAHAEGKAEGVVHGKEIAEDVAKNVAAALAANAPQSPPPPQQVEVVNQNPLPVDVVQHKAQ
jgi:hypothetical protein